MSSSPKPASKNEFKIGIEVFYTDTDGIGGRLRKKPEDFIVEEIPLPMKIHEIDESIGIHKDKLYSVAKVRAVNWETNALIRVLSQKLRIPRQKIFFAGTKDKRAVTTQIMSFGTSPENLERVDIKGIDIFDITTSNTRMKLGNLLGNRFKINVKEIDLDTTELNSILENTTLQLEILNQGFPNFFGVQRFGAIRPITHLFGKYIVQGDFESAVFSYIGTPMEGENEEVFKAREFVDKTHDFDQAFDLFPKHLGFERTLIKYLINHPENYADAIKQLPRNLQIMFIHAYQSYLFNKILSERIRRGLPLNEPVKGDFVLIVDKYGQPDHDNWLEATGDNLNKLTRRVAEGKAFVSGVLYGVESEFAGGEPGEIERAVIESEGLKNTDFIIPEIPKLSSKGLRREFVAPVKGFEYEVHMASSKPEVDSVEFKFELNKGCYATSLLREYIKAVDLRVY
jgi:tRNA pseudouridine13 synthase